MYYIIKRDGTKVPFDKQKIVRAINAAFLEVDGQLYETDTSEDIAEEIEKIVQKYENRNKEFTVEDIQDYVEEQLMVSERRDVARAYIRYRYKRQIAREQKNIFFDAISEKLEARNVQNQNANVDEHSFGGRMGEANDVMTKQYALDYCLSDMAKNNHLNNEIYIHDLSHYAVGDHNCLSIPFDDLLANGFNTRQVDIRPANSASTAFQLVAVIFQLQSLQQFGGVSATHLDWTMVPYVRKSFAKHFRKGLKYIKGFKEEDLPEAKEWYNTSIDDIDTWADGRYEDAVYKYAMDMTEEEIYQAAEALYHNLK